MAAMSSGSKPVSYTHLDVYKRQDLGRVVNAYRGEVPGRRDRMSATHELATRGRVRLTPDGILAGSSSREESIALLREHGYLI